MSTNKSIAHLEVYGKYQNLPDYAIKERDAAVQDLIETGSFQPVNDDNGPYKIGVSIEDNRLVIRTNDKQGEELPMLILGLKPYKRIIQDYFLMIESYEKARITSTREKLEAIDMGRRGLHNEGAELLIHRLKDKIDMDFDTARRFFTLICVLHKTNVMIATG